ncbi:hypothetical protein ACRQ5Q_14150 [Bradyrhizobium sp. PMVTL-01]|uniref:hypothetical protein n=1 Tax=unclassified Bradyrhizobium TaxID=2631580 RepID=UPI003F731211
MAANGGEPVIASEPGRGTTMRVSRDCRGGQLRSSNCWSTERGASASRTKPSGNIGA